MLRKIERTKPDPTAGNFAIVASTYNERFVDSMVIAARKTLEAANPKGSISVVRVPGAYEIPVVVSELASRRIDRLAAIICLGVIIRGQTAHAQLIAEAVTRSLMEIQVRASLPVVHEVLLVENERQAEVRCLDEHHNRGYEAAQTALKMAAVMGGLRGRGERP